MSSAIREDTIPGPDGASVLRFLVASALLVIGVALGLYLAMTAFQIIQSEKPPGLVQQLTPIAEVAQQKVEEALDGPAAVAANNIKKEVFDVSPELKKVAAYSLVFGLLLIPAIVVSALIKCGAQLMHSDATQALKEISKSLKRR